MEELAEEALPPTRLLHPGGLHNELPAFLSESTICFCNQTLRKWISSMLTLTCSRS